MISTANGCSRASGAARERTREVLDARLGVVLVAKRFRPELHLLVDGNLAGMLEVALGNDAFGLVADVDENRIADDGDDAAADDRVGPEVLDGLIVDALDLFVGGRTQDLLGHLQRLFFADAEFSNERSIRQETLPGAAGAALRTVQSTYV